MNFRLVQIALWALVAVACGYLLLQQFGRDSADSVPTAQTVQVAEPYVALTASDGSAVDTATFKGAHQLLYFGFTYCPDVCPIGVRKMVTADALYQLSGGKTPLKTLFASFDIERDTTDVLAEYEANLTESVAGDFSAEEQQQFALSLMALTGDEASMDKAVEQFPVFMTQVTDPDQPDGYTYTHTDIIYWIQPDGTVKLLSARHSARDIADMLKAWS